MEKQLFSYLTEEEKRQWNRGSKKTKKELYMKMVIADLKEDFRKKGHVYEVLGSSITDNLEISIYHYILDGEEVDKSLEFTQ